VYDIQSDATVRAICVSGTLSFATDKDTRLNIGVLKVEATDRPTEEGFDCDAHVAEPREGAAQPALEVGTPDSPIAANRTAVIRLVAVAGQDPQSCPAIVNCAGRMDFHGAPLSRTWLKLGSTAKKGDATVVIDEPVTGWRVGDRVIITATHLGRDIGKSAGSLALKGRV
jgi:hypothetical protein